MFRQRKGNVDGAAPAWASPPNKDALKDRQAGTRAMARQMQDCPLSPAPSEE